MYQNIVLFTVCWLSWKQHWTKTLCLPCLLCLHCSVKCGGCPETSSMHHDIVMICLINALIWGLILRWTHVHQIYCCITCLGTVSESGFDCLWPVMAGFIHTLWHTGLQQCHWLGPELLQLCSGVWYGNTVCDSNMRHSNFCSKM